MIAHIITAAILIVAGISAVVIVLELRSARPRGITLENVRETGCDDCGIAAMRRHHRTDESVQRVAERVHRAVAASSD